MGSVEALTIPQTPFWRSARIQARVIWALLMREIITRFGRRNLGVLWLIGEPMLFTGGVATLWSLGGLRHSPGIPVVGFAITGYSTVLMWRNAVAHTRFAVQENFALLYHRNVTLLDVFAARILVELAGATGSFAALTLLFMLFDAIKTPNDMLMVAEAWLMLAWFGAALSIAVGAATAFSDVIGRIWIPIQYLLFPLSGAAFMVQWLPHDLQPLALLVPMVHAVELLRLGYFGTAVHAYYSMGYLFTVNLLLSFFGLLLMRGAAARVGQE
jgi:ABC-type polysaccharide/polyol phosphate export permease